MLPSGTNGAMTWTDFYFIAAIGKPIKTRIATKVKYLNYSLARAVCVAS